MGIINAVLSFILGLLGRILPVLGFSTDFLSKLDNAISWFISLLQSASYFIPLDVFVVCMSVMLVFDNWALMFRVGQFIVKLIRG